MNKKIKAYVKALENEEAARLDTLNKYDEAQKIAIPKKLRPATAKDIVEGAIIWYPKHAYHDEVEDNAGWMLITEVLYPSDAYKAFCSEDGCRYGLEGAFVES